MPTDVCSSNFTYDFYAIKAGTPPLLSGIQLYEFDGLLAVPVGLINFCDLFKRAEDGRFAAASNVIQAIQSGGSTLSRTMHSALAALTCSNRSPYIRFMPLQDLSKASVLLVWGLLIVVTLLAGVAFAEQLNLIAETSLNDEDALTELTCAVKPGNEAVQLDASLATCYVTILNTSAPGRGVSTAPGRACTQQKLPAQNNLFVLHSNYRI